MTFGDEVQLAQLLASPTSKRDKTSQSRGLPCFSGVENAMERTPTPWEGTAHAGGGALQAKTLMQANPSGGRLCPLDYFWLVFLNYGATDL